MKVFISQPMTGLTDKEIIEKRNAITEALKVMIHEEIEIANSFVEDVAQEDRPIYYLGLAIQAMCDADLVFFASGWEKSKGCRVEHECALQYGLEILHQI